jgi:hypothetical protein
MLMLKHTLALANTYPPASPFSDSNTAELKIISRNGPEGYIIGKSEQKPGPLKIIVTTVYALADDTVGGAPRQKMKKIVIQRIM